MSFYGLNLIIKRIFWWRLVSNRVALIFQQQWAIGNWHIDCGGLSSSQFDDLFNEHPATFRWHSPKSASIFPCWIPSDAIRTLCDFHFVQLNGGIFVSNVYNIAHLKMDCLIGIDFVELSIWYKNAMLRTIVGHLNARSSQFKCGMQFGHEFFAYLQAACGWIANCTNKFVLQQINSLSWISGKRSRMDRRTKY